LNALAHKQTCQPGIQEDQAFMMRPLAAGQDASPAPQRLALRPQAGRVEIGFLKRWGPQHDAALFLSLIA